MNRWTWGAAAILVMSLVFLVRAVRTAIGGPVLSNAEPLAKAVLESGDLRWLRLELDIPVSSASVAEPVPFAAILRNEGPSPLVLTSPESYGRFDLLVRREGESQWRRAMVLRQATPAARCLKSAAARSELRIPPDQAWGLSGWIPAHWDSARHKWREPGRWHLRGEFRPFTAGAGRILSNTFKLERTRSFDPEELGERFGVAGYGWAQFPLGRVDPPLLEQSLADRPDHPLGAHLRFALALAIPISPDRLYREMTLVIKNPKAPLWLRLEAARHLAADQRRDGPKAVSDDLLPWADDHLPPGWRRHPSYGLWRFSPSVPLIESISPFGSHFHR